MRNRGMAASTILGALAATLLSVPAAAEPRAVADPVTAPYLDVTMPTPSLVDVANTTGHKTFTLAFVLADSTGCNPSWGGTIPLTDSRIIGDIHALRAQGGDVVVATGGAAGPYLEYTCGSAAELADAYRAILDATGSIGLLGFWSVGRDNGSCPGGGVSPTCSSIPQGDYEFTSIFAGFP